MSVYLCTEEKAFQCHTSQTHLCYCRLQDKRLDVGRPRSCQTQPDGGNTRRGGESERMLSDFCISFSQPALIFLMCHPPCFKPCNYSPLITILNQN